MGQTVAVKNRKIMDCELICFVWEKWVLGKFPIFPMMKVVVDLINGLISSFSDIDGEIKPKGKEVKWVGVKWPL